MIPVVGNLLLYLALISIMISIPLAQFRNGISLLSICWALGFCACAGSLLCLIYSYVCSDFTVLNVVMNSHTTKPLIYKIAASWGNHEGSMLVWILAMLFFGLCFIIMNKKLDASVSGEHHKFVKYTATVHAIVCIFFMLYTIYTSNPFVRIFPSPIDGYGLNPILQDIGLAMHPPMLYMGYVGFSIAYSAAIGGMLSGTLDRKWCDKVLPLTVLSWTCLTIGIGLGSWWAYRELGWGGFWFWDPVENASLMPWLSGIAFIHSIIAYRKGCEFRGWCILFAIMTFIFSMLGTFIVRSGLITSVHSFVLDPKRGIWILAFLLLCIVGALASYWKDKKTISGDGALGSKYSLFIWVNNLLFLTATFVVAFGTLYPSVLDLLFDIKISVTQNYFNFMMGLLCIPIMMFAAMSSNTSIKLILASCLIAICVHMLIGVWKICMASVVLMTGILLLLQSIKACTIRVGAMSLGHLGAAVIVVSIAINGLASRHMEKTVFIDEPFQFKGFELVLSDMLSYEGPNYKSDVVEITITKDGKNLAKLYPELRNYPVERQQTTETAIAHQAFYDIYVAATNISTTGAVSIRIYYKPMITWLWIGCFIMAFGGLFSLHSAFRRLFCPNLH